MGSLGGPAEVSGHLTYRHLTYTGVCRSYVRFVQKKQTYDLQTPVILVMNSVGVMSICEVLSRLKSLKDLQEVRAARVVRVVQVVQAVQAV